MPQFTWSLELPRTLGDVFDFLAKPAHALAMSPPEMQLRLLDGPERLHCGAMLTWKGRRWGLSRTIVTEVTVFEENIRWIEEQRTGPFAVWVHLQEFEACAHGTRVRAQIHFEPPAGILGRLLTAEVIAKDLQAAFQFRDSKLLDLLAM